MRRVVKYGVILMLLISMCVIPLYLLYQYIENNVQFIDIKQNSIDLNKADQEKTKKSLFSFYHISEILEEWVKNGPIHHYIHSTYNSVPHYFINTPSDVILFIHIPRTTGGAIRYHLFNKIGLDLSRKDILWTKPYNKTQIMNYKNNIVIKDFMSWNHVKMFNKYNISTKTFTILRHPIERSLSWYKMAKKGLRIPNVRKELDIESFFTNKNRYIQSYINNTMTYHFATYRDIEYRSIGLRNKYNETEILQLAKKHLKQCDFVGYYETMFGDFDKLYYTIFGNNLIVDWFTYYVYDIGVIFAWFRMRTKKYMNAVTDEELKYVENVNELDMKLWNWSLKQFDKKFIMFDSYTHALPYAIVLSVIILSLIVITCCYTCKCIKHIIRKIYIIVQHKKLN